MPGLQSFCVCTAIALASIYILQLSWFTAWLVIDERRKESGRNGLLPCIIHKPKSSLDDRQSIFDTEKLKERFFHHYSRVTSHGLYKTVVILISCGLLSVGVLGWTKIVHKFDPVLLLPAESYLRQWVDMNQEFYPSHGWTAELYSGPVSHHDLGNIEALVQGLEEVKQAGDIIRGYDCWWTHFQNYLGRNATLDLIDQDEEVFRLQLSKFLHSSDGAKYKSDFKFVDELECGAPVPNITASQCRVNYYNFNGPETHIPAKKAVTEAIINAGSPYIFSHSKVYSAWETDEIIGFELIRNLLLSILCVAIITLLLLGNLYVVIMVLGMVIITLVDIVGFLHFWDMTIDILSAVNIVLAIGLCVDYAVHIAHAFLTSEGTRQERATNAIRVIGMAVLNGGITTFLALFFCSFSSAHVFQTFFKVSSIQNIIYNIIKWSQILSSLSQNPNYLMNEFQVFCLTVLFGLYHGLVLLPVMLSIMGPASSTRASDDSSIATQSCSVSSSSSRSESPARVIGVYNISEHFDDNKVKQDNNSLEPQWVNVNL